MNIDFPKSEDDPIIRLYDYYFTTSDLMFYNVEKYIQLFKKKGHLPNRSIIKFQCFSQLWLATLYVVAEGFKSDEITLFFKEKIDLNDKNNLEIVVHWGSIHHMLAQLGGELKGYRNVTFHFQGSMTRLEAKRASFLRHDGHHRPIEWARELHKEMQMFFGEYRPKAAALHMYQQWQAELHNAPRES